MNKPARAVAAIIAAACTDATAATPAQDMTPAEAARILVAAHPDTHEPGARESWDEYVGLLLYNGDALFVREWCIAVLVHRDTPETQAACVVLFRARGMAA